MRDLIIPGFGGTLSTFGDNFFDSFLAKEGGRHDYPAVDILEDGDKYTVKAELPGMKLEDINITLMNGELTIRGEKKCEYEEKKNDILKVERSYGSFSRTFSVPDEVKEDRIGATYHEGILEVALPKGEKAKPKSIEVKVA